MTDKEKELRKQEELEKFKNSDRLRNNIRKAKEMKDKWPWEKWDWMKENFKSGAKYDLKKMDIQKWSMLVILIMEQWA